ncbi:hypothetical protein MKW94_001070 [Papaver nudicaule]|uniref:Uncharacterized protein n=1 Tax=Papaver nudicaule TaxID=74823 RepID=A0AA42APJ2_PAPNU|nr:hypothetical protein [Papaver nudicaule]
MLEKCGGFIGKDVLETSLRLEIWEVLKTLVEKRVVCKDLIENLVKKRRSDLLCLCITHVADIQSSDLVSLFKYFVMPIKLWASNSKPFGNEWSGINRRILGCPYNVGLIVSTMPLRERIGNQVNLAIDKIGEQQNDNQVLAKEASILLMIAYDGFPSSELSAPCPKAAKRLGLEACDWVPELKSVVKYLGVVLDEHFSQIVAWGARLCFSVADVVENLKVEVYSQKDEDA